MVLSIDKPVCTGPQKIQTLQKKEQLINQGHQCGVVGLPEECYTALFNAIVNDALVLMVVIFNICDLKVTNTRMG
jgi:hypothetical protein